MRLGSGSLLGLFLVTAGCSGSTQPAPESVMVQPNASDLARLKLRYPTGLRDVLAVPPGLSARAPKPASTLVTNEHPILTPGTHLPARPIGRSIGGGK
jgi:hypothetical protein